MALKIKDRQVTKSVSMLYFGHDLDDGGIALT